MTQLKEFMLLFRYEPSNEEPTQQQLDDMHKHWGDFIGGIAMQGKLVGTHQLGFSGKQITANKDITDGVYVADNHMLGGNMILKTASLEEAAELAKGCPILLMGGTVEVREIIPMN